MQQLAVLPLCYKLLTEGAHNIVFLFGCFFRGLVQWVLRFSSANWSRRGKNNLTAKLVFWAAVGWRNARTLVLVWANRRRSEVFVLSSLCAPFFAKLFLLKLPTRPALYCFKRCLRLFSLVAVWCYLGIFPPAVFAIFCHLKLIIYGTYIVVKGGHHHGLLHLLMLFSFPCHTHMAFHTTSSP